jgi:hypothetical protein
VSKETDTPAWFVLFLFIYETYDDDHYTTIRRRRM